MGGRVALVFDGIEKHAPPWMRPGIRVMRNLGPTHLAAFMVHRVKADPVFLLGYVTTSAVISQAATPFLMAFGVDPVTSFMARYFTMPIDIAVLVYRERQLRRRDNPGLSTGDVARDLLREYRGFAAMRRERGRQALQSQGGGPLPIGAH
jgi:hypothetical protein